MGLRMLGTVQEKLGADFRDCTECGICTAVCPVAGSMRYGPMRVVQLLLLGDEETLRSLPDFYVCTACDWCTQRCPEDLPVAELFSYFRSRWPDTEAARPIRQKVAQLLKAVEEWGRLEAEDLGWKVSRRRGLLGRGPRREPLQEIRDVPSYRHLFYRLRGEEPPQEPDRRKRRRGR